MVIILNATYPFAHIKNISQSHGGWIYDLDFTKNGDALITCGNDYKIKYWYTSDWSPRNSTTFSKPVKACRFSPNDSLIAVAVVDTGNYLLNTSLISLRSNINRDFQDVVFNNASTLVYGGTKDDNVYRYRVSDYS